MALKTKKRKIGILVSAAASQLGVHPSTLYRMIHNGQLVARKPRGTRRGWRISQTAFRKLSRFPFRSHVWQEPLKTIEDQPLEFPVLDPEEGTPLPNLPMEEDPQGDSDCISVNLSFEKEALRSMVRELVLEEVEEVTRKVFHSEVSSQIEKAIAEKLKNFKLSFGS